MSSEDENEQNKKRYCHAKGSASPTKSKLSAKERRSGEKDKQKCSGKNPSPGSREMVQELIIRSKEVPKDPTKKQTDYGTKHWDSSRSEKDSPKCSTPVSGSEAEKKEDKILISKSTPSATDETTKNPKGKSETPVVKHAVMGDYFDNADEDPMPGFERALTRRAWDSVPIGWAALFQSSRVQQVKPASHTYARTEADTKSAHPAVAEADTKIPKMIRPVTKKSLWRVVSDPFRLLRARLAGNKPPKDSSSAPPNDQSDNH